jgi:hypothetical protein
MWIGMAAKVMKEMFEKMKNIDIVAPTVTLRGSLKKADIANLEALADAILA